LKGRRWRDFKRARWGVLGESVGDVVGPGRRRGVGGLELGREVVVVKNILVDAVAEEAFPLWCRKIGQIVF
jgi:hypothetical protein